MYTARVAAIFASALVQDYTLLWPFGLGGDMWMVVFMVVFLMWRCSKGAMGRAAGTERQGPHLWVLYYLGEEDSRVLRWAMCLRWELRHIRVCVC